MPWALFSVGLAFALLTYNSHRPIYRSGPLCLGSFVAGWLVSELPFHHLLIQVGATAALVVYGGLGDWPGVVGLGLAVISCAGLVRHIGLARRTHAIVDAALDDALGRAPDAASDPVHRSPVWRRVAATVPRRHRDVERTRGIEYRRVKGRSLALDVYAPRDRPSGAPVLLYVHGGGWVIGNKNQQGLLTVNQLAARGWVCVSINYRLSPRATFPDHLTDVKHAIRWVREHIAEYGGDPSFLVLSGGSAGAHLASLASLTPNELEYQREFPDVDTSVQGCVAYYGVYDFVDEANAWPYKSFRILLERAVMKLRRRDAPDAFAKASPTHRVGPHAPPFFLLHGDRDSLAPVAQARQFRDALRGSSEQPVAWAELPGAQHAFEIFPSLRSVQVVRGVERFCDQIYARHCERDARGAGNLASAADAADAALPRVDHA